MLTEMAVTQYEQFKNFIGLVSGLCGNFNSVQADDFKAISGVVEGTSAAFANTWKTQADCPNVKNIFENPCTLSIENGMYLVVHIVVP